MKDYEFNPNIYFTVASNLESILNEEDMTIDELASKTEIKKSYLNKFLSNKDISISIYDLYKISVVLNTNISDFFK